MTSFSPIPGTGTLLLERILVAAGYNREMLSAAQRRGRQVRCPLHAVLFSGGYLDENEAVRRVAALCQIRTLRTEDVAVRGQPAGKAVETGALWLSSGEIVLPLRDTTVGWLVEACDNGRQVVVVTEQQLLDLAVAADGPALAKAASAGLAERFPYLSAARTRIRPVTLIVLAFVAILDFFVLVVDESIDLIVTALVALFFLYSSLIRLLACQTGRAPRPQQPRKAEGLLPTYSILVPLHDEEAALPGLIAGLGALDWPKERLDVLCLVEEGDHRTLTELSRLPLPPWLRVLKVPAGEPRTKPRALNAALPFCRGDLVVVYDAEDVPQPNQLRRAVEAFEASGPKTCVVQATLMIDPEQGGLRTAMFRMEYAGLFGVLLPALAMARMPVPLGGTSNHFRSDALKALGGWDAWNVTEDADLGLRLHRRGWRTTVIASTTIEEAPATNSDWLKQRTPWLKGWMVTLIVHGRRPDLLLRETGLGGTLVFVGVVGGIVISALAEPFAIAFFLTRLVMAGGIGPATSLSDAFVTSACVSGFLIGHLAATASYLIGMKRMNLKIQPLAVALLPFYWMGISIAAWRAVGQLLTAPSRWEKTPHHVRRPTLTEAIVPQKQIATAPSAMAEKISVP